ncbi:hypothetical protein [Tenacibaculum halocynthiae]|uniref:hypothetical protein n=1 Tax=Tenacibaculum halocynthiae TaxID=1254437 RepID=UPI003D656AFF
MGKVNTNNKKEASVDTEALTAQITQLEQEKKELTEQKVDLETQVSQLNQEKNDLLEQKEAVGLEKEALENQNKELLEENEGLKESLKVSEPVTQKSKPTKEEFLKNRPVIKIDGKEFGFKFDAPETLNIKGVARKTSELIKDKKVMSEFVYGKAFFVEPVN